MNPFVESFLSLREGPKREDVQREMAKRGQQTPHLVEEAYRLAYCMVSDESLATLIAAEALYRGHRQNDAMGHRRLLVLENVLQTVRRAARAQQVNLYLALFPELRGLTDDEQLALVLEAACDLTVSESAQVLRLTPDRVRAIRCSARRALRAEQTQRTELGRNFG